MTRRVVFRQIDPPVRGIIYIFGAFAGALALSWHKTCTSFCADRR